MDIGQAPGGMPDFETLARMMQPQMAPRGASVLHALKYGQDANRQNQMFEKAIPMAQLSQMIRMMQAEEFGAGHEGRMAEIGNKSAIAKDDAADTPSILEGRRADRSNKLSDARKKRIEGALKEIEPYVNAWDGAKDEFDKNYIHQQLKDNDITFGDKKKKLGDMSVMELDQFMTMARRGLENTPKSTLEREKLASKERVAADNNQTKRDIASDRNQLAAALKKMGIVGATQAKTEFERLQRMYSNGEQLTDKQLEILDLGYRTRSFPSEVRGATARPQIGIKDGKVTSTPPAIPPRPTISQQSGTGSQPSGGGVNFDATTRTATVNGKQVRVIDVGKDKKTGKTFIKIEGGQILPVD